MKKEDKARLAKLVGSDDKQLVAALYELKKLSLDFIYAFIRIIPDPTNGQHDIASQLFFSRAFGEAPTFPPEALDYLLALLTEDDKEHERDLIPTGELSDLVKAIGPANSDSLSSKVRRVYDDLVKQGVPNEVMNLILSWSWLPLTWYSKVIAGKSFQRKARERNEHREKLREEIRKCYKALCVLKPYLSSQEWDDLVEKIASSKSGDQYFSDLLKRSVMPKRYKLPPKKFSSFKKRLSWIEEKLFGSERAQKGRRKDPYGDALIIKNVSLVLKSYRIRDYVRKAGEFVALMKGEAVDYKDSLGASSRIYKRIKRLRPRR